MSRELSILTTEREISALTERLLQHEAVAIDLEMDAMHNYREKICLAQISTPAETFIVDPLADGDLQPMAPVFAEEKIVKIFHAVDYDLRSLKRDYGFRVHNLFDTMLAAQFCGEEKIGLADLLQKYFDVTLDKKYQKADWSQRPLSPEMIRYAAEDTRHLHRLAAILEEKLQTLGRLAWLREECGLLEGVAFEPNEGPLCLRFKGAGRLERPQLAILEALLQWRDQEAERRNRPHFKILGNKPILEMVLNAPKDERALGKIDGVNERVVDRYGTKILASIARGVATPESAWPHFPRPPRAKRDPRAEKAFDTLKAWRQKRAAGLQVEPGVLINNAQLEAISRVWPESLEALQGIKGMRRWQVAEFGTELLGMLH